MHTPCTRTHTPRTRTRHAHTTHTPHQEPSPSQELAADLAEITYEFPFRIPPYSALIIRAVSVLEGIALVGNPQFAIIDEAYPYLSKKLLTDDSPRMREALRYMVYGESKTFDVDRVIDLLQALEKFVAVRDTGDGTAYKVDGVRGGVYVGQAGDARGTKALDADGDAKARSALDAYRAEGVEGVSEGFSDAGFAAASAASAASAAGGAAAAAPTAPTVLSEAEAEASTAREALGFFFSDDGQVFREFLVEEVVAAADALSREALQNLILTAPGRALDRLPQPGFVRAFNREVRDALAPKPTESDAKVLSSIRRLLDFFLGDLDVASTDQAAVLASSNSPAVLRSLVPDQAALARGRALLPILQENQQDMRAFGLQIVGRLVELQTSRALGLFRSRIGSQDRIAPEAEPVS
jgi:aarF domain-containing kinase